MNVTDEMILEYAGELLDMARENRSYPRILLIDADGSLESGFYAQGIFHGAWHCRDHAASIVFQTPPELGEWDASATPQDLVDCLGDDLRDDLLMAIEEGERERAFADSDEE